MSENNYNSEIPLLCGKCGTQMIMDLVTLNTIIRYCPECCKKIPTSPLYEAPEKKKEKFEWLKKYFLTR
jgi:hypothetical protein